FLLQIWRFARAAQGSWPMDAHPGPYLVYPRCGGGERPGVGKLQARLDSGGLLDLDAAALPGRHLFPIRAVLPGRGLLGALQALRGAVPVRPGRGRNLGLAHLAAFAGSADPQRALLAARLRPGLLPLSPGLRRRRDSRPWLFRRAALPRRGGAGAFGNTPVLVS